LALARLGLASNCSNDEVEAGLEFLIVVAGFDFFGDHGEILGWPLGRAWTSSHGSGRSMELLQVPEEVAE